jgi:hypothetical protein
MSVVMVRSFSDSGPAGSVADTGTPSVHSVSNRPAKAFNRPEACTTSESSAPTRSGSGISRATWSSR